MNRTRTVAAIAGATLLLTACSSELTYDQAADRCIAAVKALPAGAKVEPRPKACERMTEEDYTLISMNKIFEDKGWNDENGKPDLGRILTSTPTP